MSDKPLKNQSKTEILELLLAQSKEMEQLKKENETLKGELQEAKDALAKREMKLSKAGSIAEASLMLSGVFEAAEEAAAQYLVNIEKLSDEQLKLWEEEEEAHRQRIQNVLKQAKTDCEELKRTTTEECNLLKKQTTDECDSLKKQTTDECDSLKKQITDECNSLKKQTMDECDSLKRDTEAACEELKRQTNVTCAEQLEDNERQIAENWASLSARWQKLCSARDDMRDILGILEKGHKHE